MLCDVFLHIDDMGANMTIRKLRTDRMVSRDFRDRISSVAELAKKWKHKSYTGYWLKIAPETELDKTLFIRCVIHGTALRGGYYYRCIFVGVNCITGGVFVGPCMTTSTRDYVINSYVNGCDVSFTGVTIGSLSEARMDRSLLKNSRLSRRIMESGERERERLKAVFERRLNRFSQQLLTYCPNCVSIMTSSRRLHRRMIEAIISSSTFNCLRAALGIIGAIYEKK